MKRIFLLFPLFALTAFAGYYRYWDMKRSAVLECSVESYDPYRNRDGHEEALTDIAHGKLRVVSYGLPAPWVREYREVLMRDYGIEYRAIAGCVVNDGILKYAAAYNEVMNQRIAALHGPQVFADADKKAGALYAERHPQFMRD